MDILQKKQVLVNYLNMKVAEEDWRAVARAAVDLRDLEGAARFAPQRHFQQVSVKGEVKDVPLQAVPPVDLEVPHHLNEVRNLLKLSDEELVDKIFPDYSQPQVAGDN